MTEETEPRPRPRPRPLWRSVLLPLLVIGAIAFAIWWLEYRPGGDGGGVSPISGEQYGVVDLPEALLLPGLAVGAGEGKLAPDFLLGTLEGGELRLSDLRGQAVVLNFWATWCGPCRKEIPQLVAAYDRFRGQGLVVIGVNLQEDAGTVEGYSRDFGMHFPVPIDRSGAVAREYRLLGVPTTYFIDRDGVVLSVYTGPFLEEAGDTSVQGAIEESKLLTGIREILE